MKVIASVGLARLSYAPDVKTFTASGVPAYVDPVFFLAMTEGTDPAALEAISAAIDEAVQSSEAAEIDLNAVKGKPLNMGPEETMTMMVDGIANAKVLCAKYCVAPCQVFGGAHPFGGEHTRLSADRASGAFSFLFGLAV